MNSHIKNILVFSLFLLSAGVDAQRSQGQLTGDSSRYSLLINPFIQIESTEAVDAMYNFEFKKSLSHFNYLRKQYPWHPLPYLLMGLNYWWRIVPNYEDKTWDEQFLAYMDTTEMLAKRMKGYNEIESAFFIAAANAFAGRLYSERGEYRKAAFAGRDALKYLDECRGHETYSPELLFGDALFNYYSEWIRDEYPLLRPLMLLFPKGDKDVGIKQLKEVARNAFYSRTEAQFYLMRILTSESGNMSEARLVGKYLNDNYPMNPYFHRYYTRLLYQSGQYSLAETMSLEILNRIDSSYTGYEANSGRYACFFLGHINDIRGNNDAAKKYYKMGMEFAEEVNATEMGYYYFSLLHLGNIAVRDGEEDLAKEYYKKLRKLSPRKHSANKTAKMKLNGLED
jgi:tetratricopeptide (TPR) repeat protein